MPPAFRLLGLDHRQFEPLFALRDGELRERGAVRRIATESPGFPCRVSLQDAGVGEELILLPYVHHDVASPYRASGPIFVRRGVHQRKLAVGEIPPCVATRLMSVRAYDAGKLMVAAVVCDGAIVGTQIEQFFSDDRIAYLHLHQARQGCFSCQVSRA